MKNKYIFVLVLLAAILLGGSGLTAAVSMRGEEDAGAEAEAADTADDFSAVASFLPMYVALLNLTDGIDDVSASVLTEPDTGCLHDYQISPQDMKDLADADAFVINGGGMESFLEDVTENYAELSVIDCSEALTDAENLSESADAAEASEENEHFWMNPEDYIVQVQTMADGLSALDETHAADYQKNASLYIQKIEELCLLAEEIRAVTEGQNVILFSEAYEPLAKFLGLSAVLSIDLDEQRQVSASELGAAIDSVNAGEASVIFADELYGADTAEAVEKETDVTVCYPDTLTRADADKNSYIEGMQKNLEMIRTAFGG